MHQVQLSRRQRGDFQTPETLASLVWKTLDPSQFDLIIEPTFGTGAFLRTLPEAARAMVLGWEIHKDYYQLTKEALKSQPKQKVTKLFQRDVFEIRSSDIPTGQLSTVLVIGNPPWVTNSEQSVLGGQNTGAKRNFKAQSGLEAKTGKANFDISEAIILHLIDLLKDIKFVQFAFLGKFTVLRNLMRFLRSNRNVGGFEFHRIDAFQHFGAAVDAGLIKFQVGSSVEFGTECRIFSGIAGVLESEVGLVNGGFVYDAAAYGRNSFFERSVSPVYIWRQGVKHDLSDILELTETDGALVNRLGERVDIESETLYHLHKSSDIFHGRPARFLIPIYQRDLKDTLENLPQRYPLLHSYLLRHQLAFASRKSSIYRNKNPFAVFGIGDYTHARYKVAVGGLYSEPVFRLLQRGRYPVTVDDTSYAISTNEHEVAQYVFAVLNLKSAKEFLKSISYQGDKRTFSKEVLSRLWIPPLCELPEIVRNNLNDAQRLNDWLSQHIQPARLF